MWNDVERINREEQIAGSFIWEGIWRTNWEETKYEQKILLVLGYTNLFKIFSFHYIYVTYAHFCSTARPIKTYELISVVFVVKRCCQEPLHASSFSKRGSQNWHAVVMFKVFNQNWAWWVANINEGYYSFLSLQTNFLFLFSSVASEAYVPALSHSERKRPGRARGDISCERVVHFLGRKEEEEGVI